MGIRKQRLSLTRRVIRSYIYIRCPFEQSGNAPECRLADRQMRPVMV